MGKESGVISLEELPEKEIYVKVKPEFLVKIREFLKEEKVRELSKKIKSSEKILRHWLSDESLLRLDVFKRLTKFFGENPERVIATLRSNTGRSIKNPKLPFDFKSKSGVRIIAAVLGDGSLSKRGLSYINSNPTLVQKFIQDMKNVFGEISVTVRRKKGSNVLIAYPPKICGKIIGLILPQGPKVISNPHIPSFIFDLNEEQIYEFLSQIIDDEGSVSIASRHLRIKFSVLKGKKSNLINDLNLLFKKIGIESSIYEGKEYESKTGSKRKYWSLEIHSFSQLQKIYQLFNLRNEKRRRDLEKLLKKKKMDQFPKKRCREIYLSIMKEIQEKKGYFTSVDLSKSTKRSVGSCRNVILKFKKLGLIKPIEKSFTGKPLKYVVR